MCRHLVLQSGSVSLHVWCRMRASPVCGIYANTEHRVWCSPIGSVGYHCRRADGLQNSSDNRQYLTPCLGLRIQGWLSWIVLAQSLKSEVKMLSEPLFPAHWCSCWLGASIGWTIGFFRGLPAGFPRAIKPGVGVGQSRWNSLLLRGMSSRLSSSVDHAGQLWYHVGDYEHHGLEALHGHPKGCPP